MEIPLANRQSQREAALKSVNFAKEKENDYQGTIDEGNQSLQTLCDKITGYQQQLNGFEKQRCEQIHSSIN